MMNLPNFTIVLRSKKCNYLKITNQYYVNCRRTKKKILLINDDHKNLVTDINKCEKQIANPRTWKDQNKA